jgi:hypothetical protein
MFKGMQPFTAIVGRFICAVSDETRHEDSISQCWIHGEGDSWHLGYWDGTLLQTNDGNSLIEFVTQTLGTKDSLSVYRRFEEFKLQDISGTTDGWIYLSFSAPTLFQRLEEVERSALPAPFNKRDFQNALHRIANTINDISHNGIHFCYKSAEGMIRFSSNDQGCSPYHQIVFRSTSPRYSLDQLQLSQLLAEQLNCARFDRWHRRIE